MEPGDRVTLIGDNVSFAMPNYYSIGSIMDARGNGSCIRFIDYRNWKPPVDYYNLPTAEPFEVSEV